MGVIKPPPDNLGARQRALNARVNEAAASKIPFDAVKDEPESSEVDKLYKIDLAAKYKHIDYIIDILKSGDSLYTSRALKKCEWLYEDEYSHIVNPDYLQENIFPFTSMKLKRKIVKTAAAHITKPERAVEFFHYCMRENMKSAFTCLLYTTDEFKLDQLRNNKGNLSDGLHKKDMIYFRFLIGKSILLLEALLGVMSSTSILVNIVQHFKDFFHKSADQYLDIVEIYVNKFRCHLSYEFDLKLADAIMKKHKHRVLAKPKFYIDTINTDILVRNSTVDDAKVYAKALLPETATGFWDVEPYTEYKFVFDIISHDETYKFFKNYFTEYYADEEFEMHPEFYKQDYYKFMTFEQREAWAYNHLKSEKQILGVGCDYLWYRFITFDVAFKEIKKFVSVTKDADVRSNMVKVLIESARNDRELETLFKYYNKRHMNEGKQTDKNRDRYILSFLDAVISRHNVFEFDEGCWTAFYSLFIAKNVLSKNEDYKIIGILWNILHEKTMPQELINYLLDGFKTFNIGRHLNNITDENKRQMLHNFLFSYYMSIISESKNKNIERNLFLSDGCNKFEIYFDNMAKSMEMFNKHDLREPKKTLVQPQKKERHVDPDEFSGRALIRDLKRDKNIVIGKLSLAQTKFESSTFSINCFLKKLKIYFHHDVSKIYFNMFQDLILNEELEKEDINNIDLTGEPLKIRRSSDDVVEAVYTGVNAIFQLADQEFIVDFMDKYCPLDSREDRKKLGIQHLRIQRAICAFACLQRPPVPLANMIKYLKGDYARFCLHIFEVYLSILPLPMCQQFVGLIIDAPVSIQKHAIRLAFKCFSPDNLKEAILIIWKNTKNVSVRSIIYQAFFNKVVHTENKNVYDVLETITLDLNKDDENAIFDMTVSYNNKLPEQFLGDYIKAVWETVKKFKDLQPNITRKKNVISYMRHHIHLLDEEFASTVINDHISTMILKNKLPLTYSEEDIADLHKEKWSLFAHYIVNYHCLDNSSEKYVQFAQYILRKNIENWDELVDNTHVYQKCSWDFFNNIKTVSLQEKYGDIENAIPIFEGMMKIVNTDLEFYDSYLLKWELHLMLISANAIKNNRHLCEQGDEFLVIDSTINEFGEILGVCITEYVENKTYCMSFTSQIKDKVESYTEEILKRIYNEINEGSRRSYWPEYRSTTLILLAETLVEYDLAETHLLAVQLLPWPPGDPSETYIDLINKFQAYPNPDVQVYLYKKFQKYCTRKPRNKIFDPSVSC